MNLEVIEIDLEVTNTSLDMEEEAEEEQKTEKRENLEIQESDEKICEISNREESASTTIENSKPSSSQSYMKNVRTVTEGTARVEIQGSTHKR